MKISAMLLKIDGLDGENLSKCHFIVPYHCVVVMSYDAEEKAFFKGFSSFHNEKCFS